MKIIKHDTYRSDGRFVNQDDDMVRLVIDITKREYYKLIKKNPELMENK